MDTKEIAGSMDGSEYGNEPASDLIKEAKEAGIVIVFGASDDLMEFRGAVDDEIGCYDGGIAYFTSNGLAKSKCDHDGCPYAIEELQKSTKIIALWCKEEGYSWTYKTEIPHETYEIVEDGEPFCRGIVFKLSDI
jgi:hypothetical protein